VCATGHKSPGNHHPSSHHQQWFDHILVVCGGNICRSPIGESLLQQYLPEKTVASAGIVVDKSHLSGKPADSVAIEIAAEHGLDLEHHRARQLTAGLCAQFDLILVMEKKHLEALTAIAPEARGKTLLFSQWVDQQDIPDPYRRSKEAFVRIYQRIENAAKSWAEKLS
jgi:protein-tyrosine phosphatase